MAHHAPGCQVYRLRAHATQVRQFRLQALQRARQCRVWGSGVRQRVSGLRWVPAVCLAGGCCVGGPARRTPGTRARHTRPLLPHVRPGVFNTFLCVFETLFRVCPSRLTVSRTQLGVSSTSFGVSDARPASLHPGRVREIRRMSDSQGHVWALALS